MQLFSLFISGVRTAGECLAMSCRVPGCPLDSIPGFRTYALENDGVLDTWSRAWWRTANPWKWAFPRSGRGKKLLIAFLLPPPR